MFVLGRSSWEQKLVVKEYHFTIYVFHNDPEHLGVDLLVPPEIRCSDDIDT
jgi:hypothetical protein